MRTSDRSHPQPSITLGFARAFAVAVLLLTGLVVAVIALYAIKSKLGINLMQGPSPLHGVFVSMRLAGLV